MALMFDIIIIFLLVLLSFLGVIAFLLFVGLAITTIIDVWRNRW